MANKTINEAFAAEFGRIRERARFVSTAAAEFPENVHDACIQAAISKCLDFNVIVNRERANHDESFVLISGMRGIVEDLIVLKHSLRFSLEKREIYIKMLQALSFHQGILAQRRFFDANNPFQVVVGSSKKIEEIEAALTAAKENLRQFWIGEGRPKGKGPNVSDMASEIGLRSTYDYIYFAASNFVHFNPHALFRMGWGPKEGPFSFSTLNFSGYYRDLAAVYGAMMFVGFAATFSPCLDDGPALLTDAEAIEKILMQVPRWPELVTFEEINMEPPDYTWQRVLRDISGADNEDAAFSKILKEVRG